MPDSGHGHLIALHFLVVGTDGNRFSGGRSDVSNGRAAMDQDGHGRTIADCHGQFEAPIRPLRVVPSGRESGILVATKSLSSANDRRATAPGSASGSSDESSPTVTPRLIAALAREGSSERAERYLRQASDVRLRGDVLEVVAPSPFVADLISRRIGGDLCRVASQTLLEGRKAELRFRIAEGAASPAPVERHAPIEVARARVAPQPSP
ncbi:MAG: hypothetical protein JNK16_03265, partial [Phycisphaerales bacterium]|nr:hypothetical protein [Phycisphaerales bacterium]